MGIVYACGIYTAKQQGIIKTGQIFKNFWGHHYFDWILWARRSAIGAVGGVFLGTLLFGDAKLARKRVWNKYDYYVAGEIPDPRAGVEMWTPKLNN